MDADSKDGGPLPSRPPGGPPPGVISIRCEPADPELLREVLDALKAL